jgi:hypothetical protein
MKYFLIGSRLIDKLFPDHPKLSKRSKTDSDYDILIQFNLTSDPTTKAYFKGLFPEGSKIDLHYIPELWEVISYIDQSKHAIHDMTSPTTLIKNVMFTLKASHVPYDKGIRQEKTFYDLYHMSEAGCEIQEPLFFELEKRWEKERGEKWRADFSKESEEFFDDAVSRESLHDELHKSVAYYDQPAFKFLQEPDQTTVWVCPDKFWNTTDHIRERVIIEEAQALALERFILPGKSTNKQLSYQKMIKALVDRLAPLWMVPYIINNLYNFLNLNEDYGLNRINQSN